MCAHVGKVVLPSVLAACARAGTSARLPLLLQACTAVVRGSRALPRAAGDDENDGDARESPLAPAALDLFARAVETVSVDTHAAARPSGLVLLVEMVEAPALLPPYEVRRAVKALADCVGGHAPDAVLVAVSGIAGLWGREQRQLASAHVVRALTTDPELSTRFVTGHALPL